MPKHSNLPVLTFELRIEIADLELASEIKQELLSWLVKNDITTFVEGSIDGLEMDPSEDLNYDPYEDAGGASTPISVYRFDRQSLVDLHDAIKIAFGTRIRLQIIESKTDEWTDGWKSSFQPIVTKNIVVYPPWTEDKNFGGKIGIEVEPGMAFGTGQHATTQLCLNAIEELWEQAIFNQCLDVGTGTGILAIALKKLGASVVACTDIDPDSVAAATANAQTNEVQLEVELGSIHLRGVHYDLVVANILKNVVLKLWDDINAVTKSGSYSILSGFLVHDVDDICHHAVNWRHIKTFSKGDWAALVLQRK